MHGGSPSRRNPSHGLSRSRGQIIAGRPYKDVDDLLRISGVGPKLLDRIRPI